MTFNYFSRRFSKSRKHEHIIKIREVIILPYIKNRALSVVLTIYKEYKKNIRRNIERIYSLYIVNILFLYFLEETDREARYID